MVCYTPLAWSAEAIALEQPPSIDGVLTEWGGARHLAIEPAADGVGLRGAFNGEADHQADIYIEWDAQYIYIAAVVEDDVLDVKPIPPSEHEWKGAAGQRKDRMFYYDHLKIFLRGPEIPLGYNLWISPGDTQGKAYAWGGRQRELPSETLPIRIATGHEPGLYTYEVAIPWDWLEIYPQPDMRLDGLFLFTDADDSALDIGDKIRAEKSNWIWWKGKVHLIGEPPGLKPPPQAAAESAAKKILPQIAADRVDAGIERMRRKQAVIAQKKAAEAKAADSAATRAAAQAKAQQQQLTQTTTTMTESESAVERTSATQPAFVSALLNRRLLAKRPVQELPAWVLACNADSSISNGQVDSLVGQLKTTLHRLFRDKVNSRTNGLVMSIAEYAGSRRDQARPFLRALLSGLVLRLKQPEEQAYQAIVAAAGRAGVEKEKAVGFVISVCQRTEKSYKDGKVKTTSDIINKSRREAGLKDAQVSDLLGILLVDWGN